MAQITSADERRRSLKPLRRLFPYITHYRTLVVGAIISLVIAAATTLALPLAVRRMIDHGFSSSSTTFIAEYFAALVAMAALLAAASAGRYYFVITLGERVVADIRRDVFAHVTTLSPAFFDTAQSGEIVSRLAADTTQVKSAVGATASVALRNVILGLGAVGMMVITSPKLSGLVIAAIPVIVLPLVAFGRSVRRKSRQAQDTLADATAYASEQIGAVRTLQAFTNEKLVTGHFSAAVEAAFEAARSSIFARSFLTFFAIFTIFSSVVAVLWFGSRDVLEGSISPGTLGQFLLYSVFAAGARGALWKVWGDLAQGAGAADRLTEIRAEKRGIQAPADPKPLPAVAKGAIVFDNISFSYPARPDRAAVHGLSFQVMPGETVAIVGPSGAGKSTVFSLILRFYDPETGKILIDGVDVREADPVSVRQRIAIVPQDVTIFAASARDNIGFGRPGASKTEIETAAKDALADEFILKLEKGYDSQVGERGVTLSGGQRQRVAIARAILRDAPILLLDEATSALDAESETLVQTALERLMQGRTTIVIAHRLATVLKADRILVMDGGSIVEE
ncbi:ATP-binding cassette domain-containing protein, partial [Mesorhizobium sp. M7A.F.Ca.AU.002.06.1.1]|uniref:ABC transporter transmembrane domain-containing protein n=1 Tax=Mesorhizobium sp. M7A.F.Ca.AU.002.06.1.1 TaxID=2496674 RepID=UPI000FCA10A6